MLNQRKRWKGILNDNSTGMCLKIQWNWSFGNKIRIMVLTILYKCYYPTNWWLGKQENKLWLGIRQRKSSLLGRTILRKKNHDQICKKTEFNVSDLVNMENGYKSNHIIISIREEHKFTRTEAISLTLAKISVDAINHLREFLNVLSVLKCKCLPLKIFFILRF